MNSEIHFAKLSAVVFDEIVALAGRSPLCDEYDCNEGVVELFLRQGAFLIVGKADLGEIWVSSLAIGAERFYLDDGKRFVNKSGEEIVSWIKKILQL
ncbi:frataxin domain-containing protein [Neorickettsia sennetsu]|nr:frataxin domain-containing protein [Neorickettsia sennetsu]